MYAPPVGNPARIPLSGSKTVNSISVGPGSEVKTASLAAATSRALSAQVAPISQRLVVASRRTSWTVS